MARSGKRDLGNIQTLIVVAAIMLVALAMVLIGLTDLKLTTIVCIMLAVFGLIIVAVSLMASGETGYGPSDRRVMTVGGLVFVTLGLLGAMSTYGDVETWLIAAVALVMVAVIVLLMGFKFKR